MPKHYSIVKYLFLFVFCVYALPNLHAQNSSNKVWAKFESKLLVPIAENGLLFSQNKEFQETINKFKISNLHQAFPNSKNSDLLKVYEFDFLGNEAEIIKNLAKVEGISYVEISPKIEALYTPNDYNLKFSVDYALDIVRVKNAWDISMGDSSIIIGVSDTNFDTTSIELNGQYNYIDEYIFDSDYLHGTAVANQISGKTDNFYGKSSIAPKCRLRLYSMGYNSLLQACYEGAKVINASWASGCNYSVFGQMICDEIYNQGVIIVAAAGNGGTCGGANNLVYPSAFDHVISVTSIGATDNHEKVIGNPNSTHQHNSTVDLSAPGYFVPLAANNNTFITANGSSFAAPIVTGAIGLILSVNPCLTPDEIETILKSSAKNIDSINPAYAGKIGAGRIDVYEALKLASKIESLSFTDSIIFNCEKQKATIDLFAEKGTAPYTYNWSNGFIGDHQENIKVGNYGIEIIDSKGCKIKDTVSVTGPIVKYDYDDNLYVNSSNFEVKDLNNDGIIRIGGKLIIEPNVNFEINDKKIQFGKGPNQENSGILIQNGATLSIKNYSIIKGLNQCNTKWDGIEIADNKRIITDSANNQTINTYDKSGTLIMDKSSLFDAVVAIKTLETVINDSTTIFGTISISNSLLHDNQTGIDLISNKKSNNSKNYLIDCILIVDDSLIKNVNHLKLSSVSNLQIIKNGFFGNINASENEKGSGIYATNSNLFIASDTTSDVTKINNTKGNDFYNLFYGIRSLNTLNNKIQTIQISGSNFKYVNQGINLDGNTNGLIYKNEFNQPSGSFATKSFSINCENNNELIISENTVNTSAKEQQNVFGIILKNSLNSNVNLYKNTFSGTFNSINYFEGDNLKTTIDCNNYSGNSDHAWYINSGKLRNQDGLTTDGKSLVYLNSFENNSKKESQIYINPKAEALVYQTIPDFTPQNVSPNVLVATLVDNIQENGCLNYFQMKQIIPEKPIDTLINFKSNLYPNPSFNGATNISWNDLNVDKIQIINLIGETIVEKNVSGKNGSITLTNIPSGSFFVKFSNKDEIIITKKLVVN